MSSILSFEKHWSFFNVFIDTQKKVVGGGMVGVWRGETEIKITWKW